MTDKPDPAAPESSEKQASTGPNWTSAAALAGAAIGSAALAAALLYASRRKERLAKAPKALPPPSPTPAADGTTDETGEG